MARQETGLGRADDKVLKNQLVIERTPGPEDLEPRVVTGDQGMMVTEYAPYGVIGAITPTTNPTSTIINNAIAILSAGNSVDVQRAPERQERLGRERQAPQPGDPVRGRSARSRHLRARRRPSSLPRR